MIFRDPISFYSMLEESRLAFSLKPCFYSKAPNFASELTHSSLFYWQMLFSLPIQSIAVFQLIYSFIHSFTHSLSLSLSPPPFYPSALLLYFFLVLVSTRVFPAELTLFLWNSVRASYCVWVRRVSYSSFKSEL